MGVAAFISDGSGRVLMVRENYGNHRYGFPGGAVEPGEDLQTALLRECREEIGTDVSVEHIIAIDCWLTERGSWWLYALFRCNVTRSVPALQSGGEIAEVVWANPLDPPLPLTHAAGKFLRAAAAGERGIVGWLNDEADRVGA